MAELSKAELRLWIYDGDISTAPNDPQYILTKTKLSGEESIVFEVSELIKDYVEIEFNGDYDSLKQTKWVKIRIERTYDDDSIDHYSEHGIAFRGYGELVDGINPELSKDLMISNTVIHNYCGRTLSVPFYTRTDGVTKVSYASNNVESSSLVTGSVSDYTIAQDIRLNPSGDYVTIDKTASILSSSDESSTSTQITDGVDSITYSTSDGEQKSIEVKCIDDCRNTPYKISFINKFGVMQDVWFFARRKDSISSEREQYKKNILKVSATGASYDISDHQRVYLENQGRETITMNTGFIDQSYNNVMKELLVSEYVYIHDPFRRSPTNSGYDLAVPINVVTSSLDFKTKRDDKLINYELQFEMDSEFIQSIR